MPRAGSERAITLLATAATCLATGISSLAYGILGQPASAGSGVHLADGGFLRELLPVIDTEKMRCMHDFDGYVGALDEIQARFVEEAKRRNVSPR